MVNAFVSFYSKLNKELAVVAVKAGEKCFSELLLRVLF
jgi:hypothetical protein